MKPLLIVFLAYLLGSIPFSHIFPKLKGKDARESGTKNVGATNALIVAGPLMGALALVGDLAKGYLPVALGLYYNLDPWVVVFAGLAAVLGHDFSLFLKFRGGKGVATTGGVFLAIEPLFAVIIMLLWVLIILVTRYFIPSTIIILGIVPVIMYVLGKRVEFIVFAILAFVLALYAHREDIKRFFAGQELKTSEAVKHYLNK